MAALTSGETKEWEGNAAELFGATGGVPMDKIEAESLIEEAKRTLRVEKTR
jgi:hypothetical protein